MPTAYTSDALQTSVLDALPVLLNSVAPNGQIRLLSIPRAPLAQQRSGPDEEAESLFERGLELRAGTSLPFWDAVLLSGEERPAGVPDSVFEAALLHQPLPLLQSEMIKVDGAIASHLARSVERTPEGHVLALASEVTLETGEIRHLPMIDFTSKARRPGARPSVEGAARALGLPGYIVESGQSFHFYGQTLLTSDGLRQFLQRAILLSPIVDGRWVGHQLLEGMCSLRISPTSRGGTPRVVARSW